MIYVTHDQVEAMTMADRSWCCARRIEQVGAPLELYDAPEPFFVAGFIGSPGGPSGGLGPGCQGLCLRPGRRTPFLISVCPELPTSSEGCPMRSETPCNDSWAFAEGFDPAWVAAPLPGRTVSLPHTAVELPLSYFDEKSYQRAFTYQRVIPWEDRFAGREVSLQLEGAMADALVLVNGQEVARHRDGYTPFEARLTPHLRHGDNLVTVRIDGSENPEIPPFGGQIDYLTYAGLYREVHLRVTAPHWIANVKIETPEPLRAKKSVHARVMLAGEGRDARVEARLTSPDGTEVARTSVVAKGADAMIVFEGVPDLRLWCPEDPALYRLDLTLTSTVGEDRLSTSFGFRTARVHT
jgi:beta-galactosidase